MKDADFAPRLIDWQRAQGRHDLPWQQVGDERDAYRVWLAEIMLQQTQVAAVIPYYRRFLVRFPDVHSLAEAPPDDVLAHWAGLGYYSRARHLHAAAREVVARFDGRFPDDPAVLETLPGIGRSTAAAIAAFAYGRRAAILDGNVKRVLARVFAIEGDPTSTAVTRRLWSLAESLLPDRDIERYTQGLMDLGATRCTPRRPACLLCPFHDACRAHIEGRIDELPGRKPRKAVPERETTMLVVRHRDAVLLERRPPVGIWGGLWSLPEVADEQAAATRAAGYGSIADLRRVEGFRHAFTHFVLHAAVVEVTMAAVDPGVEEGGALRWMPLDRLAELGLPTPVRQRLLAYA